MYEFKFADFGLSKNSQVSSHTIGKGTPLYMAPEQTLQGDKNYTDKIDVYPMGLILFELVTGTNADEAGCFVWKEGIDNEKIRKVLV